MSTPLLGDSRETDIYWLFYYVLLWGKEGSFSFSGFYTHPVFQTLPTMSMLVTLQCRTPGLAKYIALLETQLWKATFLFPHPELTVCDFQSP